MPQRRWPAVPKVVAGLAGPIKVSQRRGALTAPDGDDCWGLYLPAKRTIALAGGMPPALRWHTLIHEWAHAWLIDAGLPNLLHGDGDELDRNIEVVCDTLATAMVRAMATTMGLDPLEKKK
jgi:Zn-dependent peptidase ImmA (M78 family)